jgi:D-aspartate ligase
VGLAYRSMRSTIRKWWFGTPVPVDGLICHEVAKLVQRLGSTTSWGRTPTLCEEQFCWQQATKRSNSSLSTARPFLVNSHSIYKLCTYRAAEAAGVPTPRFWVPETREQIRELEAELVYPLILKPILGHKFSKRFSTSYFVAHDFKELLDSFDVVDCAGIRTFLVELIPGPDDRLCSYYTYRDESGRNLINYTKRIIRRYPVNMGSATYHITDDVPGVQELASALLRQVGLQGVANVEFKMDKRDGKLKLIECNARFTAPDCLLVASGLNLPLFVYNRLIGRESLVPSDYRTGVRLWKPVEDFLAYRQLSSMGSLTFGAWIRSILHPQILPVFRWSDPLPAIVSGIQLARHALSRLDRSKRDVRKQSAPRSATYQPIIGETARRRSASDH